MVQMTFNYVALDNRPEPKELYSIKIVKMVGRAGIEPAASKLGIWHSIRLS